MPYKEYAKALISLAKEENKLTEFGDSLKLIRDLLRDNPDFKKLLTSYSISNKEKKEFLEETFKDLDPLFLNFLFVLVDNNRFTDYSEIYSAYKKLLQDENNIMRVVITSSQKLSEERIKDLTKVLSHKYEGKKIIINNKIDETLIGGIKILLICSHCISQVC